MNVNRETGEMVAAPSMGALVSAEQQRAIAEVQAAMILARMNPRDQVRAESLILKDCERTSFVETALYAYARGGTDITGLSIHAAQAMAQRWGNIDWGTRELEQRDGESVMQSYAWDLETNARKNMVFVVPHVREVGGGTRSLSSPRDVYELTANQGSRRTRACLLGVIPDDLADKVRQKVEETLLKIAAPTPERIEKMVAFFAGYGIEKSQIEDVVQRKMDALKPVHVVRLMKIANSLKDGMAAPGDWFKGASKVVKMPSAKPAPETQAEAPDPKPTPAAAPPPAATTAPAPATMHGGSAPAAPVTTLAPTAAPSVPTAAAPATPTYIIASVVEKKSQSGRTYSLITTKDGLVAHTWSTTVAGDAKEAQEDGRRVRLLGKTTEFGAAPLQVNKVESAEREPGEDDGKF